LLPQNTYKRIR